ncbi:hypothetical protein [Streptomyces aureus]|uniref:hypothetical protein n=1 Tax=Streptomyces aureus TaxID=193461 RepID=UPI0033D5E721
MEFTRGEQDAITAHVFALGLSADEYIRGTVAVTEQALHWQRERGAVHALAHREEPRF